MSLPTWKSYEERLEQLPEAKAELAGRYVLREIYKLKGRCFLDPRQLGRTSFLAQADWYWMGACLGQSIENFRLRMIERETK